MIEHATIPARGEVPVEFTWDLTKIYPSDAAWEQDIARLETLAAELADLTGTLAQGADALLRVLQLQDTVGSLLWQIYVYASLRKDSDSGDPAGQALGERAGSVVARIAAAGAYVEPEILAVPDETIATWQREEPALAVYAYSLEQLSRQRAHVRSAEVESVLAEMSDVTRAPGEIFEALSDVDLKFPMVTDEQGQPVQLSHGRYGSMLESPDRRVRQDAFLGMFGAFGGIRTTAATTLAAHVRGHVVNARLRGYPSSLAAALQPNDLPIDVYHNLIATINANLPRLHRYVELRKRLTNLEELHWYDLYAPLVPDVDLAMPYAEAVELMQEAFAPLGTEYASALDVALHSRWIDVYENRGKRSGAYSGGAYTTPPFVLLNYQDRLGDAFTFAHELGHALHSYFTRRTQPYVYGHYTTFLAEVASTLNEALLNEYLLTHRSDPALRRYLIVQQLEAIRTTIIRQTLFAEFELEIHRRAEQGEPLVAELLDQLYFDLVARYYGPGLVLDKEVAWEWARIPHFYANFYVFQYATGLTAALALHQQLRGGASEVAGRYLQFLSSGSSQPSITLLREAGVDMATPAPIQAVMDRFEQLLDELESAF